MIDGTADNGELGVRRGDTVLNLITKRILDRLV